MLLVHLRSRKEVGMWQLLMRQSMLIVTSMRLMLDSTRLVGRIRRTRAGMTVVICRRWLTSVRLLRKRVVRIIIQSRERMVTSLRKKRTSRRMNSRWSIVSAGKPMTNLKISNSSKNQSRESQTPPNPKKINPVKQERDQQLSKISHVEAAKTFLLTRKKTRLSLMSKASQWVAARSMKTI